MGAPEQKPWHPVGPLSADRDRGPPKNGAHDQRAPTREYRWSDQWVYTWVKHGNDDVHGRGKQNQCQTYALPAHECIVCRLALSQSHSGGKSNWVPVTAVNEEKPDSVGMARMPSNTTGSERSHSCLRDLMAAFKVRWSLSTIPLQVGWYAVVRRR